MIVKTVAELGYVKRRPRSHKLEGITTRTNPGFVIASFPRPYPKNGPQRRVSDAAKACGIKKGITRRELVDKMVNCIPSKFEE